MNLKLHKQESVVCYLNGDIFKQLIVEGVGTVELEEEVVGKDMLDALNHVLRLRLWKKKIDQTSVSVFLKTLVRPVLSTR